MVFHIDAVSRFSAQQVIHFIVPDSVNRIRGYRSGQEQILWIDVGMGAHNEFDFDVLQ